MRVEENRFDLLWRVGHELVENSLVSVRSVWTSAKRGTSGLKRALVVPYFEEKQPEPFTTSDNLLKKRCLSVQPKAIKLSAEEPKSINENTEHY